MANELTRTSSSDVAHAQQVVNRHGGTPSQDTPGGPAAAAVSSPAIRAVDAKINAIMALAHGGMIDGDEYERRQPELLELIAEKNALMRGSASATAVAPRSRQVPASVDGYPELPDVGQPTEVYQQDATVWARQLPKLLALGISYEQAVGLSVIAREAEADSLSIQDGHRAAVHAQSVRELQRRYGASYATDVKKANEHVKTLLPNGASRQLCSLRLADGSTLGDSPLFVRLLIELAREAL